MFEYRTSIVPRRERTCKLLFLVDGGTQLIQLYLAFLPVSPPDDSPERKITVDSASRISVPSNFYQNIVCMNETARAGATRARRIPDILDESRSFAKLGKDNSNCASCWGGSRVLIYVASKR